MDWYDSKRYVRKVMRLIFLGQAEGSGNGVSGPGGWWRMSGKQSDPDQLPEPLQIADCLRSGQLFEHRVTGQNAQQCRSAIREKVLRFTRKFRYRDACYDTESLRE